jgi:hypothetical protein
MVFAHGWCFMAIEKSVFGDIASKELEIGDIVEWSKWNSEKECYEQHFGVLLEIKNEIKSNRFISVSKVLPLNESSVDIEFFTLSLRLISKGNKKNLTKVD